MNDLRVELEMPEESGSEEKGQVCLTERYLPSISPEKARTILLSLFQQERSAMDSDFGDFQMDLARALFKNQSGPRFFLSRDKLDRRYSFIRHQRCPVSVITGAGTP